MIKLSCIINGQFIAVIQAILAAGKRLQQLQIEEDKNIPRQMKTVRSALLRKLISTASSSNVISAAAKFLSSLNKEAAGRRDLENLFIISDGKFPEVQTKSSSVAPNFTSFGTHHQLLYLILLDNLCTYRLLLQGPKSSWQMRN